MFAGRHDVERLTNSVVRTLLCLLCRRLMVRHGFVPLLVHMLETSSKEDAALHAAFIRRAASTFLARLANRCGLKSRTWLHCSDEHV